MAFVPALRDPTSHEHHVLLSSLNRTVSVGPPRGEEHRVWAVPHGTHGSHAGGAPAGGGARLRAPRGDGRQVGTAPQCPAFPRRCGVVRGAAAVPCPGAAAVGTARVLRHTARGECGRAARGPAALGGCGAARPRRRPPFPVSSQRRSPAQRCSPAPTASPALWERTGTPRARPSATATTAATTACARTPAAAARSAGGYRPPSPSPPRRPACPPLSAPRVRAGAPRAATFGSWGCAASGE